MADTIAISKSDIGGMREFSGSRPFHMPGPTLSQILWKISEVWSVLLSLGDRRGSCRVIV
jgi:hypothetical protein